MYDSYIRAIKWATLRVHERGVIAYVTNGGFLDSNTADGMRKALSEEFQTIYVFNLRGNQRTAGEQSRKEGGKVFGGGSRATVAITLLVKNPDRPGPASIHYADIGDYLSRDDKLAKVTDIGSVLALDGTVILPNAHGDWLNQRRDDFNEFPPLGPNGIFEETTLGVMSGRDAWVYGSSSDAVSQNVARARETYLRDGETGQRTLDSTAISWTATLERRFARRETPPLVSGSALREAMYRPFFRQRLYYEPFWLHQASSTLRSQFVPGRDFANEGIYQVGSGSDVPFSVFLINALPDLHVTGAGSGGQFFARWRYEQIDGSGMLDLGSGGEVIDGYRRIDNITDDSVRRFQATYPRATITKDDLFFYCYGLLHSQQYREAFAADLKKVLPRIPMVRDFTGFADAGRALAQLHLAYEGVDPYTLDGLHVQALGDPFVYYAVGNKKMSFGKATPEQQAAGERYDRSVIHFNDKITLRGVPEDAYRYMLGSRSAIEWIIDRYYVKTDKDSGIVNDPNDWSREVGDPRYILDLLARVVSVSVETMKIVDALPTLDIIQTA